ncbi:hypothetical protein ABZT26_02600 [Streptomyces sp. NPDC005395]|uniref:hypothetical protein n=1 Tax=Streptomyces sp. NPDC005395 TaxID=3157042 RepID=UPI0033AD794E
MLDGYLALGGVEIANSARLEAYLETIGSPLDSVGVCHCDTFTAELVGDEPYTTSAEDEAPWYDEDVPESGEFAGLMVLTVDGLDDNPVARTVTQSAAGGAVIGPARPQPLTITVTGLLLGSTCCGAEYGLRWLSQALAGCAGPCGDDCLTLYNCCPGPDLTEEEFAARHRRTLRRVALVDGPRVTARQGDGCTSGTCKSGADVITVEFVLTAASPWQWADPVTMLDRLPVPTDDGSECITWCVHGSPTAPARPVCIIPDEVRPPGAVAAAVVDTAGCSVDWPVLDRDAPCDMPCRHAPCPDPQELCGDPSCRTPTPPAPPQPETCFCQALAVNSSYAELDLSRWPRHFGAVPMIEVYAGSTDLRRLTVEIYERTANHEGMTCEEVAVAERCNPHSVYEIAFVPAGGWHTLDGQVGRAFVECGGVCEGSPDAYGRNGGPLTFPLLDCASYCVAIQADAIFTPADDATITLSLAGRDYSAPL